MSEDDGLRWDQRYAQVGPPTSATVAPPRLFAAHQAHVPVRGSALELACGEGTAAVWLARRGLDVLGVDVSTVAVERARALAEEHDLAGRCRFEVVDLDGGLPPGPPVDLLLCHLFRDPRLDRAMVDRLAPGGVLAVAVLSEVGAQPGRFRAKAGELLRAFATLEVLATDEADGVASLLAKRAA